MFLRFVLFAATMLAASLPVGADIRISRTGDRVVAVNTSPDIVTVAHRNDGEEAFVTVPGHTRVVLYRGIRARDDVSHTAWIGVTEVPADSLERAYRLPFAAGASFRVTQGEGGPRTTHQGRQAHAVDFAMPEGTPVHAARGGRVVEAVSSSQAGGLTPEMRDKANQVTIQHADGTVAVYGHLAYNGVTVSPGDTVREGDLIGYSGNTGYSSGPHLHFAVTKLEPDGQGGLTPVTLPVKFRSGPGGFRQPAGYATVMTAWEDEAEPESAPVLQREALAQATEQEAASGGVFSNAASMTATDRLTPGPGRAGQAEAPGQDGAPIGKLAAILVLVWAGHLSRKARGL